MRRDAYKELSAWKQSSQRNQLLMTSARQTGKTHLLKTFGTREYGRLAYFNFEETPSLGDFFVNRVRPGEIIRIKGLRIS